MDVYVPNFTLSRAGKSVISRVTWAHGCADGIASDVLYGPGDTSMPAAAWTEARGIPAKQYSKKTAEAMKKMCRLIFWVGRTLLAIFKQPEFDLHPGGHPSVKAIHIWRPTGSMIWVELRLSQQEAIDLLDTYLLLWGDRENRGKGCPTVLSKYAYINSNNPVVYYQASRHTETAAGQILVGILRCLLCSLTVIFICSPFFSCAICLLTFPSYL